MKSEAFEANPIGVPIRSLRSSSSVTRPAMLIEELVKAGICMSAPDQIDKRAARRSSARAGADARRARDQDRRTPTPSGPRPSRDFKDAGLLRVFVPRAYGGYALPLPTVIETAREIGEHCGSSAWCLAICTLHNWMSHELPRGCSTGGVRCLTRRGRVWRLHARRNGDTRARRTPADRTVGLREWLRPRGPRHPRRPGRERTLTLPLPVF